MKLSYEKSKLEEFLANYIGQSKPNLQLECEYEYNVFYLLSNVSHFDFDCQFVIDNSVKNNPELLKETQSTIENILNVMLNVGNDDCKTKPDLSIIDYQYKTLDKQNTLVLMQTSDIHDCDTCGSTYADGYVINIYFSNFMIQISCAGFASCFVIEDYHIDDLLLFIIYILDHSGNLHINNKNDTEERVDGILLNNGWNINYLF